MIIFWGIYLDQQQQKMNDINGVHRNNVIAMFHFIIKDIVQAVWTTTRGKKMTERGSEK